MILNERDARHEHILQVARQMMTAARSRRPWFRRVCRRRFAGWIR